MNEVTKYDERFAEMAQAYAGSETVGGSFLSTQGGILSFDGEAMPGNQMAVVILDVVRERTYYTSKFDASSPSNLPPVCYAFGRDDDEMAPHTSMQSGPNYFVPQSGECVTCPFNEWGSADTGRGKACSERRRMAVIPAGYYEGKRGSKDLDLHLFTEEEHYVNADIAFLKLPVMSVKDWARYVTMLAANLRRPPLAVITRVHIEPDPKSQFRVKFDLIEEVPPELFDVIMRRHEEAKAGIVFGYPVPEAGGR
jgi:hypothetical protein